VGLVKHTRSFKPIFCSASPLSQLNVSVPSRKLSQLEGGPHKKKKPPEESVSPEEREPTSYTDEINSISATCGFGEAGRTRRQPPVPTPSTPSPPSSTSGSSGVIGVSTPGYTPYFSWNLQYIRPEFFSDFL
jgi:hypothetical protein